MNISVGKHIYAALSAIDGLTVYPVIAAFDTAAPTTPFAVYQRTSASPEYTKSLWTGGIAHNYSITLVASVYDNTVELAQQAIDAILSMSYQQHDDMRVGAITVTDLSEDFVDGLFIQTINFTINTTRI